MVWHCYFGVYRLGANTFVGGKSKPERRALALHSTPCGLVQINNVHYKHALSDRSELTVLPLVNKQTGAREFVGCHLRLGLVDQQDMGRMMFVRPAEEHQWIDIGAGTPGEEEFARPVPR